VDDSAAAYRTAIGHVQNVAKESSGSEGQTDAVNSEKPSPATLVTLSDGTNRDALSLDDYVKGIIAHNKGGNDIFQQLFSMYTSGKSGGLDSDAFSLFTAAGASEMNPMISEQRFDAVRMHFSSPKPYEQLLASLLKDIGDTPVDLDALERDFDSWESYRAKAESLAGPSGFMLFGIIDHGGWMRKVGSFPRSTRVILGNPALAITMLKHDVNAGLFAPVELLLVAEPQGGSRASIRALIVKANECRRSNRI
nr:hypothetical protein [Tanacetum cinerariifolium]